VWISDEFLLFNKETGYTWLIVEGGHFSLSEELSLRPVTVQPKWARPKSKFEFDGRRWTVFERVDDGSFRIDYVDGELPWVARQGDSASYMDAISPPFLLSAEWTESEMEWYRAEYLPRKEVADAFGMHESKLPAAQGVAPHQPYPAGPFRRYSAVIMAGFFLANLAAALWFMFTSGRQEERFTVVPGQYAEETLTESFAVHHRNTVCTAKFSAPVDNSWIYLDVALVNDKEEALLDGSADISYYHGVEGGESWSEGSQSDSMTFLVRKPGDYRFLVKGQAGTGETPGSVTAYGKPVKVTVYEDVILGRYHVFLALFAGAWAGLELIRRGIFEARRWRVEFESDD